MSALGVGYSEEEIAMAILVTADVPGQTAEGLARMMTVLEPKLRQAKGFIAVGHSAVEGGLKCFEVWESQEDATKFFAEQIHPLLPPGVKPKRTIQTLVSLVKV
jgi:hypothetical protein